MRKNVKNDSVIRAITLGIAGMMTLTATVGAFPMQVQAEEGEGEGNTPTTGETAAPTTETTVAPDPENASKTVTDTEGHQITVKTETVEQYVVNNGEATTNEKTIEGKVEDYITVETTVEAKTHHVVVTETTNADGTETTTEIVSGVTSDGEVVEQIEVAGEDVAPEQVNIVTEMTGEGEEATIKEIVEVEDEDLVYGYFDDNGLFQEDEEKNNENTKAYVVDVDGTETKTYKGTTNVTSYETVSGAKVYLTDEYDASKLKVDVVCTVKGADLKDHEVKVVDDADAAYQEKFKAEAEGKTVTTTTTSYTAEVYQLDENTGVYNKVTIHPVGKNYTAQSKPTGQDYAPIDIDGTLYYVHPSQVTQDGQTPQLKVSTETNTTTVTKYYVKDKDGNDFEVSAADVVTETKYTLEYTQKDGSKTTLVSGVDFDTKERIRQSIETHKYVAVNQNMYAITVPDGDDTKTIYINTDDVSVLTTHNVTFTETKTHYYVDKLNTKSVDSSKAIIEGKKGLQINGEEYLVEVSFKESSKVKPQITDTQFSYVRNKKNEITDVKVVVYYTVNGDKKECERIISMSEFSKSNIATLTLDYQPVTIKSGVAGYTFSSGEQVTVDGVTYGLRVTGNDGVELGAPTETGKAVKMETTVSFGGLKDEVSQKNLIVKTYVRLDDVEQKENGTTHYPTDKYTPALSQYLLKYSSAGYDVYGILDENGNLQEVHSDKPYPGEDRFTQEDAIKLYLSQEDAEALKDLAKDYANRGTIKDATEAYVNKYVDDQIAKLKEDFIAAHPEWDPDEIVWTLTDDDIAQIKQQAIDSARVHWYVLKYEKDNYHIDGVLMIDEITIELNGEVEVIPPTVVPTPDPEPNPGPAPTEPEPTPAPTPVVLGVNRTVETAQAVAPAEEGAVLGARRADGGSVLGASRTKAVLGARRGAQTGDVSGIAGSVSALFASAFAGIGYVVSRRKKKEEDK